MHPLGRDVADYRRSLKGRRQSWFGLKRYVKRSLAAPVLHPFLQRAARLVPFLHVGRLPAPTTVHEVTGYADGARFILRDPERCEIAKELYWGGGRRPEPDDAFALDLVVNLARRADVFLDVGAYTGVFTVATAVANATLRAHAFEIVPAVAETLRENLERNGVADRVVVHQEGVGAPHTTMRVPTGEGGSALPSFYSARMQFDEGIEVSFRALDEAGAEVGEEASVVMKVDVEGAEDDVFRYGQDFLARHRPDILCEILYGEADSRALQAMFDPHGLRYYLVRDDDLLPVEHIRPHPRHRDWLITRRSPGELISLGIPVRDG